MLCCRTPVSSPLLDLAEPQRRRREIDDLVERRRAERGIPLGGLLVAPQRTKELRAHVTLERLVPHRGIEEPLGGNESSALEGGERLLDIASRRQHVSAQTLGESGGERSRLPGSVRRQQRSKLRFCRGRIAESQAQQPEEVATDVRVEAVVDPEHGEHRRRRRPVQVRERLARLGELVGSRGDERRREEERPALRRDDGSDARAAVDECARVIEATVRGGQVGERKVPDRPEVRCARRLHEEPLDLLGAIEVPREERDALGGDAHQLVR